MILQKLDQILEERKQNIVESTILGATNPAAALSYVVKLYQKGDEAICKKIAEEATEVVMASKDLAFAHAKPTEGEALKEKSHLIYEVADLWFHSMVLLQYHGLSSEMVLQELARREGLGGLLEKASREES